MELEYRESNRLEAKVAREFHNNIVLGKYPGSTPGSRASTSASASASTFCGSHFGGFPAGTKGKLRCSHHQNQKLEMYATNTLRRQYKSMVGNCGVYHFAQLVPLVKGGEGSCLDRYEEAAKILVN